VDFSGYLKKGRGKRHLYELEEEKKRANTRTGTGGKIKSAILLCSPTCWDRVFPEGGLTRGGPIGKGKLNWRGEGGGEMLLARQGNEKRGGEERAAKIGCSGVGGVEILWIRSEGGRNLFLEDTNYLPLYSAEHR